MPEIKYQFYKTWIDSTSFNDSIILGYLPIDKQNNEYITYFNGSKQYLYEEIEELAIKLGNHLAYEDYSSEEDCNYDSEEVTEYAIKGANIADAIHIYSKIASMMNKYCKYVTVQIV